MAAVGAATRKKRQARRDSESSPSIPSIPGFVETMQPHLVEVPPRGPEWLHEIKYDGYRTLIAIGGGQAHAYTRNGNDWTSQYALLAEEAARFPCISALIDGEVCVQDERGVTDFGAVRSAIAKAPHKLVFFAFDLLHLNGQDLRDMPLEDRRELLSDVIEGGKAIVMSHEFDGDGATFFAAAEEQGLEGIVSKRKGSRYVSGETSQWVKSKCWAEGEFDVIGVKKGDDGLPYALFAHNGARMGAAIVSLKAKERDLFWRYVEGQGVDKPTVPGPREKKVTWVRPGLRAAVRYLRGSDKLRHASIKALMLPPADP